MPPLARPQGPNLLRITLCLLLIGAAFASIAASAQAAQFRMLLCAGNVGSNAFGTSTNTTSPQNPGGIFNFSNGCGPAPDPAGEGAFLRISENQSGGVAGQGAFGNIFWDAPSFVHFKTAGGYTRQPNAFNEGWRARFWGLNFTTGVAQQFVVQGLGLPNSGGSANTSNTFGPHVWPFGGQLDFNRFVYEMTCVRAAGCDRTNFNATDLNTLVFTMEDDQPSQVALTNTGAPFLGGQWVRGAQLTSWNASDLGSGLRFERVFVDGANKFTIDYQANGSCDTGTTAVSGEFARVFQPCPTGGPFAHTWPVDTATLADGPHTLSACTQDYGQFQGLNGTGGQTCSTTTIRTDNTAPGAPAGLEVTSANPARYLDHFDAHWTLPPNEGSPITKIHYDVVNSNGDVVVPEQTTTGENLSQVAGIAGPATAGAYRLRVWLEDAVGFVGPVSVAAIPHDTTPPAAPQDVAVTAPSTSQAADGFDVRWRNVNDSGSPIDAVHYKILDGNGDVVVPDQTVSGESVHTIPNLDAPVGRGDYKLSLWLTDAEGNVGVPVTAPLSYECVRSEVGGGTSLDSGLGKKAVSKEVVKQGSGSMLTGHLSGSGGKRIGGASICIFSRVVTDHSRDFLGVAVSGSDGAFQFAVPPGASREFSADYRSDHREVSSDATIETVVAPTFKVRKKLVYNKHRAFFEGQIPGPHNDKVVLVLQVKRGKGWEAFHRYRTRANGHLSAVYKFSRTNRPTEYIMRVQARETVGYPYLQGNSKPLRLIVRPKRAG